MKLITPLALFVTLLLCFCAICESLPVSSENAYDAMNQVPPWHCLRYFRTLVRKCRIFKPGIRRT